MASSLSEIWRSICHAERPSLVGTSSADSHRTDRDVLAGPGRGHPGEPMTGERRGQRGLRTRLAMDEEDLAQRTSWENPAGVNFCGH